jgi:hypothetical protein
MADGLLSYGASRNKKRGEIDAKIGDALDYYLGPTGIPDKMRMINEFFNPVNQLEQSAVSSQKMFAPDQSIMDRVRHGGDMLSGMAGAVAPVAAYRAGAMPIAKAVQEGLLGVSIGGNMAADAVLGSGQNLGKAAADTYMIGQKLSAPSGYSGPKGRPSEFSLPGGEKYESRSISPIEEAARSYMRSRGIDDTPLTQYPQFSEERAKFVAAAYDMMEHDPSNPAVKQAYDALISETMDQYNTLKNSGIDFKFMKEGMDDPYSASPALGYKDLVENGKLWVFPTDFGFGTNAAFDPSTNPLLTKVGKIGDKEDAVANDAFRVVHDTFGHFGSGNPYFRHKGEERAFLEHSRMYSPEARGAMASETRGQNSWLNFGPFGSSNRSALGADTQFADQKTGLLQPWAWEPKGMPNDEERAMLLGRIGNWTGK